MALKYPELMEPFKIGKVEIKNRIVMSPMMVAGYYDENRIITNDAMDYFEERAKGGVGLIFTGGNVIHSGLEKSVLDVSPFAHPSSFVRQMKKLVDRVQQYDTRLFIQIGLLSAGRAMFADRARAIARSSGPPLAVSAVPNLWDPSIIHRALTTEEVECLIQAAIKAAVLCKRTGCDGINVAGPYGGYFADEFATAVFNHRTDAYGGSIDGRLKVFTEIIKGIKSECGKEFPVTLRFGSKHYMRGEGQGAVPGEEYVEFGRDVEESIAMAKKLEEAGYDGFMMGNGSYDSFHWLYPPMYHKDGLWLNDVAKLKAHVNIPVICSGKITVPEMANNAIKDKMVDAVALGRALLADAEWANKARTGEAEAIRPCISCNNGCIGHIFSGLPLQCAVNADLLDEKNAKLTRAECARKIAVIGGGIAGMEAARVAALRGHRVTIYEKGTRLGGVVVAGSVPAFKEADNRLLQWYERELKAAGVAVAYNREMTVEQVAALDADGIVVATGATTRTPPIQGINQSNVTTAIEVLLGEKEVGEHTIIIGGGQVGCELALWLNAKGKKVTIVEVMSRLLTAGREPLSIANRLMLEDLLAASDIEVLLDTNVSAIREKDVEVVTAGGPRTLAADSVVLAIGYSANNELYKAICRTVPKKVWLVGDAKSPANIMFAVRDGAAIGRIV